MAVRRYRKNIYFREGLGFEPLPEDFPAHFKFMGPVLRSVHTYKRVEVAITTLLALEQRHPRSGRGSRSEIIERAVRLLTAWNQPNRDSHTLSDELSEVLEELEMAITYLTPIYTYYGEYYGDSQYVGIFPDLGQIEESVASGELVRLYVYHGASDPNDDRALSNHLDALEREWSGHVLVVRVAGRTVKRMKLYWIFRGGINRLVWSYVER